MTVFPRCIVLAGLIALLLGLSSPVGAQDAEGTSIAFTPSAGIGPILDHGNLVAWSANVLLEVDVTRASLRWSLFGSVRGIGAACADGCDLSGTTLGLGTTYLVGSFGVGGGMGLIRQGGSWHAQPYAALSAGRGRFRGQVRVEVPRGAYGLFLPVLAGVRVPVG